MQDGIEEHTSNYSISVLRKSVWSWTYKPHIVACNTFSLKSMLFFC
jgi:hypothetical protein